MFAAVIVSCDGQSEQEIPHWKFSKKVVLEGISPIGIVGNKDEIWISDVDNNQIVQLDLEGNVLKSEPGFERPMHLTMMNDQLYIPEYLTDTIRIFKDGKISSFKLNEQVDGLGGIALQGNLIAVSDFYNHRIILQKDEEVSIIAREGHNDGELYYPTDIQIVDSLIYVADAYNNRVQVFDFQGNYVQMIGWNEEINVATGVKVSDSQVFLADFENSQVLVYDLDGNLLQTLTDSIDKPADMEIIGGKLFIANYRGNSLSIYEIEKK
jgi:6-bladed beta-propeller